MIAAESPTQAPTGGDAILVENSTLPPTLMETPTPSPSRSFSVRVGESDWIWPRSKQPTRSPIAVSTGAPNSQVSVAGSKEPTKSPSVSRSTHFFLQLQENLAAIKESDEMLASDYPSGAPSVRRGFFT